jgi:hypothetical protein
MSQPPPLPQQTAQRKRLFTTRRVIGVIVVLVVVRGCFWGSEATETDKIVGKWTQGDSTIEFTDGGKFILTVDSSDAEPTFGTYKLNDSRLIVDGDGLGFYEVEFRSENELLVVADYQERELEGRWQRLGVATSVEDIASLDDAGRSAAIRSQIKDLQKRRASIQELIEKAVADKSGLVVRLRQSGVNRSSDLKSNPAARRIAQDLVRLTREIQSLQRDALRLDEAIGKAESLVRRIEQSQVAISSQEFSSLTGELLTAAEIQDGSAANSSPDPISLDTLLNEALTSKPTTPVRSINGKARQLVGKWKIVTGRAKGGILELNPKGSAIFTYFEAVVMKREETILGNWKWQNGLLELQEPDRLEKRLWRLEIEFISPNQIVAINKDYPYGGFGPVSGKLERLK